MARSAAPGRGTAVGGASLDDRSPRRADRLKEPPAARSAPPIRRWRGLATITDAAGCVIVLDAVGVGELPDAAAYGDAGSSTLANVAEAVGGLELPNLQELGLGNVMPLQGLPARRRAAVRGRPPDHALGRQGHHHRPLGAHGHRHARADADVPRRLPARRRRRVRRGDRPRRARQRAGLGHRDHPAPRRRARADGQVDPLHVGRLRLPDRGARGGRPARRAVRRLPHRARAIDRPARGRARHRAALRRHERRLHAAPPTATTSRSRRRGRTTSPACEPPATRCTAWARSPTSSPARTSTRRRRPPRTPRASSRSCACSARSTTG